MKRNVVGGLLLGLALLGFALPAAAQNPVSISQLKTTAIDTNSGNKSDGTQRVVLATDQPTPTNPFNVQQTGNWLVQGLVAHDAPYSGNPLPLGCYAAAAAPAAVADGDMARMWCLTNGALSVNITNASLDVTAASLPLPTGAATSANQTTANASLSSIDGKLPALVGGRVPVDGSGVTQPISAAALPLPTGAATAAKQPALGTAGTPSTDVITVQGITSMTALKVDGSAVTQPVSIAAAVPVTDNSGSLTVDAPVGTPVFVRLSDGSAAITNLATNLAQVAGSSVATGNGTAAGSIRVALPTDGTGVVGLNAGTNLIGQVGRKNTFDAASTLTTTTNFTSLGSGSGWSGGAITTTGCYDIRFRVQTKGSSASNTGYIDWYLASSIAGETTFDDAASSSADQAFTAANRKNSRYVSGTAMNGTSAVTGSFSALDAYPTLPGALVPVAINNSGAALSSTAGDHVIKYECVR